MTLKERVKSLSDERGISLPILESTLGFGNSTIVKWDKSTPKADKLEKVAEYFGVTTDYLLGRTDRTYCNSCGMFFDPLNEEEKGTHQKYHFAWEKAVIKYGFCWNSFKSDELELLAKRRLESESSSTELKLLSAEDILKAHFSNELRRHDFNYLYDFNHFAALELGTSVIKDMFPKVIYDLLVEKYGIKFEENVVPFTAKDERDIKKDLDSLMEKLSSKEYGPAAYDGEDIPEDDQELFAGQLELMLRRLKAINKEKYNPNKNKE